MFEAFCSARQCFLTFSDLNLDFTIQPTRVAESYSITENVESNYQTNNGFIKKNF